MLNFVRIGQVVLLVSSVQCHTYKFIIRQEAKKKAKMDPQFKQTYNDENYRHDVLTSLVNYDLIKTSSAKPRLESATTISHRCYHFVT